VVVVGESERRRADRTPSAFDFDQLEAGEAGPGSRWEGVICGEVVALKARQLDRLEHRLGVLMLVAEHHLVDDAVTDAALLDHLEGAGTNLLEVLACGRRGQERQVAALRAGRLECVVDVGQVVVQKRPPPVAMHEP
jgi:hypothetical protein